MSSVQWLGLVLVFAGLVQFLGIIIADVKLVRRHGAIPRTGGLAA